MDLLAQSGTSGQWANSDGAYTIPTGVTSSNVKDYVISEEKQQDTRFGSTARYVVKPARRSSGTKDRFYVMSLENLKDSSNNTTFYWYFGSHSNYGGHATRDTSTNFGTGRANTEIVLSKYMPVSQGGYGNTNARDMWNNLGDKVSEGWFVPSRGEWAAFGNAFGITQNSSSENYYKNYSLSNYYWTSSQNTSTDIAFAAVFPNGNIAHYNVIADWCCVRLSTTF